MPQRESAAYTHTCTKNTRLYRDDELLVFKGQNKRSMDIIRKKIIKLFKEEGYRIEIKTNMLHST